VKKKLQEKPKYPWSNYTLRAGGGRPVTATQYTLYIVQIAVVVILSYLSVVMLGPLSYSGISFFYFVYPFIIVFTLWWGVWGMLGGYIGCVIGAGLMVGLGVVPSVAYAISDLVPFLVMFVLYRGVLAKRGIDPLMRDLTDKEVRGTKTHRGWAWLWFIVINVLVLNAISAEMGVGIQYALGLITPDIFWGFWYGWFVGDGLAMIIITPILVKGLTSLVERQGLVNYGWVT
jgi:integral membrane sensor domain MASE1